MPNSPVRQIASWANLIFWLFFSFALFFRNLPWTLPVNRSLQWFNDHAETPLGLYHFGWNMFDGRITSTPRGIVRYYYADGSTESWDFFPLRSSMARNVWNEVLEDFVFRDSNPVNHTAATGFILYECKHHPGNPTGIDLMSNYTPLTDLWANGGYPSRDPAWTFVRSERCSNL